MSEEQRPTKVEVGQRYAWNNDVFTVTATRPGGLSEKRHDLIGERDGRVTWHDLDIDVVLRCGGKFLGYSHPREQSEPGVRAGREHSNNAFIWAKCNHVGECPYKHQRNVDTPAPTGKAGEAPKGPTLCDHGRAVGLCAVCDDELATPAASKPQKREVYAGGAWLDYERLHDPDSFDLYKRRRIDGVEVAALTVESGIRIVGTYDRNVSACGDCGEVALVDAYGNCEPCIAKEAAEHGPALRLDLEQQPSAAQKRGPREVGKPHRPWEMP